jgi:hypothetical protein
MQDVQQKGFAAYFTKPINSGSFIEDLYNILR